MRSRSEEERNQDFHSIKRISIAMTISIHFNEMNKKQKKQKKKQKGIKNILRGYKIPAFKSRKSIRSSIIDENVN